ncbi:TetR/AcrR family transcriptional regulator [Kribbella sp. NPDC051770]|uniref:TetR/AcrR family transcriptional regulator n=1 Tax=Kribbella sp. NPDC051770 TaxID=3155413 RepID=UPI00342EEAC7
MPEPQRRRRAGGAKRTAVLEAVATVLADRGYEGTRFADVSAVSGVAISTLQNYFGSREDMVVEALGLATDREVEALAAVAAAEPDPWRRLVAMTDRSLENPTSTQQLLVEFWRAAMRDDELRAHSHDVLARYRAPFLAAVTEGVVEGSFSDTYRPADVTDFLLTALAGAIVSRALRQPAPDPATFREVLLGQLGGMLGHAEPRAGKASVTR